MLFFVWLVFFANGRMWIFMFLVFIQVSGFIRITTVPHKLDVWHHHGNPDPEFQAGIPLGEHPDIPPLDGNIIPAARPGSTTWSPPKRTHPECLRVETWGHPIPAPELSLFSNTSSPEQPWWWFPTYMNPQKSMSHGYNPKDCCYIHKYLKQSVLCFVFFDKETFFFCSKKIVFIFLFCFCLFFLNTFVLSFCSIWCSEQTFGCIRFSVWMSFSADLWTRAVGQLYCTYTCTHTHRVIGSANRVLHRSVSPDSSLKCPWQPPPLPQPPRSLSSHTFFLAGQASDRYCHISLPLSPEMLS